jgi:adenine phosphoribosyltransferase
MVTGDDFQKFIRSVPDFPKKGIVFRDITTLLKEPEAYRKTIDAFVSRYRGDAIRKIVSVESRGFIFGSALAYALGAGFVPVRKPGKLPAETVRESYQLEYGSDTLELHRDAIVPGERVLIIDDLLATGGTMVAASALVERLGGTIAGLAFLIELSFLQGRKRLSHYEIFSLISYDRE